MAGGAAGGFAAAFATGAAACGGEAGTGVVSGAGARVHADANTIANEKRDRARRIGNNHNARTRLATTQASAYIRQ